MILITVGTQLPFDRLVRMIDQIAPLLREPVFAQIGRANYRPTNIEFAPTVAPDIFAAKVKAARLIVAHAGIGTVFTAQKHGKPLVLVPRETRFGEHRNDHQLATCRQLLDRPGVYVATDQPTLAALLSAPDLRPAQTEVVPEHRQQLLGNLQKYLAAVRPRRR